MNELLNELLNQCRAIRPDVRFVTLETHYSEKGMDVGFYAHATNVAWGGETIAELLDDIRSSNDNSESVMAAERLMTAIGVMA